MKNSEVIGAGISREWRELIRSALTRFWMIMAYIYVGVYVYTEKGRNALVDFVTLALFIPVILQLSEALNSLFDVIPDLSKHISVLRYFLEEFRNWSSGFPLWLKLTLLLSSLGLSFIAIAHRLREFKERKKESAFAKLGDGIGRVLGI